jgi:hypothetical protein
MLSFGELLRMFIGIPANTLLNEAAARSQIKLQLAVLLVLNQLDLKKM